MNRDITFDIMKGIAIIAVLIGHTDGINLWGKNFIYSFHMPLFFILSGCFFRDKGLTYGNVTKKNFKRLIVPYLFTCLLLLAYTMLYAYKKHNMLLLFDEFWAVVWAAGYYHHSPLLGDVQYIGPIWFLVSLFWCKLAYLVLYRQTRKTLVLPIAVIVSICAVMLDYYVVNLPLGILPGLSALVFYAMGHYIKESQIPQWIFWMFVCCWALAIWHATAIEALSHNPMICICRYACWPLDVGGALGGVFVVYLLSKRIEKYTKWISQAFAWCGSLSLPILCFHVLELNTAFFTILYQTVHVDVGFTIILLSRVIFVILLTMISMKLTICRKIFQIK